ncbi:MAG: hypothetical protein M5U19_07355 [Microthrixaceae bacterium]|nr:hypothetical protein [Microthrixaceae bacterium]
MGGTIEAILVPTDEEESEAPYEPGPGDAFTVIDADWLIGTFDTVEGPLEATYDSDDGDVILSLGGVTGGCTVSWDGGAGDGRWDTAANWDTDVVPGSTDRACIPEGSTAEHSTGTSSVGSVDAQGTLRVSGGTLGIAGDSSVSNLQVAGGILDGSGDLAVTDTFTWTYGTVRGGGVLRLAPGSSGSISGTVTLARHLQNEATLVWQSGSIAFSESGGVHAHLDNHATLEIRNPENAYSVCCTAQPIITNRAGATITKTVDGITTLGAGGNQFTNDGTVRSVAGLLLIGGGTASGGSGTWVADANLSLHAGTFALTGAVTGSGQFSVSGAAVRFTGSNQFNPAQTAVTGGSLDLDQDTDGGNTTGTLAVSSGVLDGDADLAVTDAFTWTYGTVRGGGVLRLVPGSSGSISGTVTLARHLQNEATLVWQSGSIALSESGGVHAHLDNHATFEIRNPENAYSVCCTAQPTITNRAGATITKTVDGITTLGAGGNQFINDGTIRIGSASTLQVGDTFTQGTTGRLQFGLAGTSPGTTHGRLLVSGQATLAGTVASTFEGGFTSTQGEQFLVLDAASLSGSFATVDSPLVPHYDTAAATVTLVDETFVPVPPTVSLSPQSAVESSGTFMIEVRGIGGNVPVEVPVHVLAGTAGEPADFSTDFTPTTVTVLPGGLTHVPVTIEADTLDEDDETFTVVVGGAIATMTVVDDDEPPQVVIDGLSITEGDEGTVDATLSVRLVGPFLGSLPQPSGRLVTVEATTHAGTALAGSDYIATSDIVVFQPGQTTKLFTVPIVGDTLDEDHEQFTVTLQGAVNATVAEGEMATVTIVDDDSTATGDVAQQLDEGGGQLFDLLDDWGGEYDLDRNGPSPSSCPGTPTSWPVCTSPRTSSARSKALRRISTTTWPLCAGNSRIGVSRSTGSREVCAASRHLPRRPTSSRSATPHGSRSSPRPSASPRTSSTTTPKGSSTAWRRTSASTPTSMPARTSWSPSWSVSTRPASTSPTRAACASGSTPPPRSAAPATSAGSPGSTSRDRPTSTSLSSCRPTAAPPACAPQS